MISTENADHNKKNRTDNLLSSGDTDESERFINHPNLLHILEKGIEILFSEYMYECSKLIEHDGE